MGVLLVNLSWFYWMYIKYILSIIKDYVLCDAGDRYVCVDRGNKMIMGRRLKGLGILYSVLRRTFFSLLVLTRGNIFLRWMYMELSIVCLVPCVVVSWGPYSGVVLLLYLVIAGVSSAIFAFGIISPSFYQFFFLRLILKFGLWPFRSWMFRVIPWSSWFSIIMLCVGFKYVIIIVSYCCDFGIASDRALRSVCVATMLSCSVYFSLFCYRWYGCLTKMVISSGSLVFILGCLPLQGPLYLVFGVYTIWCIIVVVFVFYLGVSGWRFSLMSLVLYFLLLIKLPLSLSILYKFVLAYSLIGCGFPVITAWFAYTIFEQVYLIRFILSTRLPKKPCYSNFMG